MKKMNSSQPYLLRAIYEWIVDNEMTPYLLVNAESPDVQVPIEYVNNGKIMLNIAPEAVQGLTMSGSDIDFHARFNGTAVHVFLPVNAALAIYAKENGRGMVFNEEDETPPDGSRNTSTKDKNKGAPTLRLVK